MVLLWSGVYMTIHSAVAETGVIYAFTVARGQAFKDVPSRVCKFFNFSSSQISATIR